MAISQGLSIGAVAARTGLAVSAIRFYETDLPPERSLTLM